jgi:hypothetical protein
VPEPLLRADVVRRSQLEVFAIPEGRVVAGVVVEIRHQDVEGDPLEELAQRCLCHGETLAHHLGPGAASSAAGSIRPRRSGNCAS